MTLTYYECSKHYSPLKISFPKEGKKYRLERRTENVGLTMCFEETGMRDMNDVSSPTIYICHNRGILRLNRHSFFNVVVPDELKHIVNSCSDIEVNIEKDCTYESVFAHVRKVLRFPEMLELQYDDDDDDCDDDGDLDEENDDLKDEIAWNAGCRDNTDVAEISKAIESHDDNAHRVFNEWLIANSGTVMCAYSDHDCEFVMAHCMERIFLVSFFDGKSEDEWLGDEWGGHGFRRPYWISNSNVAVSPLYGVMMALGYLRFRSIADVCPIVILGDDIQFGNVNEMIGKWDELKVFVCRATAEDENIGPFDSLIKYVIRQNYAPKAKRGEVEHAMDAMRFFNVEQWE
ncbi:MAG: hypothetical protein J5833_02090 [Victivallales bacterium]|nr:hypothetical protein [Victivallales bacterium]